MDIDPVDASPERATSSEPGSAGRPKPFDDTDRSSRKRQRINSGLKGESDGVDAHSSSNAGTPRDDIADTRVIESSMQPQTPPSDQSNIASSAPNSSKVTLNLRSNKNYEAGLPNKAEPVSPSKMSTPAHADRMYVASAQGMKTGDSDISSASSSTTLGSPQVELVNYDEDIELEDQGIPVEMIDEDDEVILDVDPVLSFPYNEQNESFVGTLRRIRNCWETEFSYNPDLFETLGAWIQTCLSAFGKSDRRWFESYQKHTELWNKLPNVIGALNNRSVGYGDWIGRGHLSRRAMVDFFALFAELTARFVFMDIKTLKEREPEMDDRIPVLASTPYLRQFATLLQHDYGVGSSMHGGYHKFDWDDEAALLVKRFTDSGATIPILAQLAYYQLPLLQKNPKVIDNIADSTVLVGRIVVECRRQMIASDPHQEAFRERAKRYVDQAYQLFVAISPSYQDVVQKHPTCLNRDAAFRLTHALTTIFDISLTVGASATSDIYHQHAKLHPDIPRKVLPRVISLDWKFRILKKCIVFGQMQVRVYAVEAMCKDLLDIFNDWKNVPEGVKNPIYRFFDEFIISEKLVDYIVGTGSHPELIAGSGNVVGFLVATKAYSEREIDIIWHTISTSEDPRVVDATIQMQSQITNLYSEEQLLYYCQKAMELSLPAFTPKMKEFIWSVFEELCNKRGRNSDQQDARPFELCIRLLQESSATPQESSQGTFDTQLWATKALQFVSSHGLRTISRQRIYQSLIKDISGKTQSSTGSICAFYTMLQNNVSDLRVLTSEHDLTRLLVEHLEFTNKYRGPNTTSTELRALNTRHQFLQCAITMEPDSLSGDLGKRLWIALVGPGAPSYEDRTLGWQILNNATSRFPSGNSFLRTCFKEYLPALDPGCFQVGTLAFAKVALDIWYLETQEDLLDDDSGLEQAWRMALTAPPDSIEPLAINFLVEIYLESPRVLSMQKSRQHALHLRLVNRCLTQLSDAALQLQLDAGKEPIAILEAVPQVSKDELYFTRSLWILREFLKLYHAKPRFIVQKQEPLSGSTDVRGELKSFKFQVFDGKTHGEREMLEIGTDNTIGDLFAMITKAVGFSNFKVYHWGTQVGVDKTGPQALLKDLKIGEGLLLVQKQDGDASSASPVMAQSTTLEGAIMGHFKDLWDFLGMPERLSQEIYTFLIQFPVYPELSRTFDREETTWAEVFPLKQPFKCLYAVHALEQHLKLAANPATQLTEIVSTKSLGLVRSALIHREVVESCENNNLRELLALKLVQCLDHILQDYTPSEKAVSSNLTPELLSRLLDILNQSRLDHEARNGVTLVLAAFETILDAAVLSKPFFVAFVTDRATPNLMKSLLLSDSRQQVRRGIMKHLKKKCNFIMGTGVPPLDICEAIWPMLFALTDRAAAMADYCDETFELASIVFHNLTRTAQPFVDVDMCLLEWAKLLLRHESTEIIGFNQTDRVARGLAKLLNACAKYFVMHQRQPKHKGIAPKLIKQHLFPEFSDESRATAEHKAVLDTVTRKCLYETVVSLTSEDKHDYDQAMRLLWKLPCYKERENGSKELVPGPQPLELIYERSRHVRSSAGYCGLKNQSNTCYLNSLMTQLFMNPLFRTFMMNVDVEDQANDQGLLVRTRYLFAEMQNSYRRFIDTWEFISEIRTYDEVGIDVNIQMDVDEFYNLLFDRWEGQIESKEDKCTFRSFYGGQLVQQVKSKECPHISERLEPFSAIQCDIKGKSTLEESLQAYVDGEVMEGDNKYKCSTCDKHVNAVKRACLKDVPDNIIFHLKRFDFNLRTMMRSKINDYFKFPHNINMRPYTVEQLMKPERSFSADDFELVGILVHAGTAESGHYYSYIRERPSNTSAFPTWFEFNDDNVTYFDPVNIESHCFGGMEYRNPENGNLPFERSWNAYMLFYQRSSVVKEQQQQVSEMKSVRTPEMPMPEHVRQDLIQQNEELLRRYLMFDDNHATFILKMLDNDRHLEQDSLTRHVVEDRSLRVVMKHFDQVVARAKGTPNLQDYVSAMKTRFELCWKCARIFLEWIVDYRESLKTLLLRIPEANVRSDFAKLIVLAKTKMTRDVPGFVYEFEEDEPVQGACDDLFDRLVRALDHVHGSFQLHMRAWPDYFSVLWTISQQGTAETVVLIENGYLAKVLEILTSDPGLNPTPQMVRMLENMKKRPVARPIPMECIVGLLESLLHAVDFSAHRVRSEVIRYELVNGEGQVPLNAEEYNLLMSYWPRTNINMLVEKLLCYGQNPDSVQSIITILMEGLPEMTGTIGDAIRVSVTRANMNNTAMCINAALKFLQLVDSIEMAEKMYQHVARITRQSEGEVQEHLRFYMYAPTQLGNNKWLADEAPYLFTLTQIPIWAPRLLTHFDGYTRDCTEDYLKSNILMDLPDEPANAADAEKIKLIIATIRQMAIAIYKYFAKEYVQPQQQVLRSQLENAYRVLSASRRYFNLRDGDGVDEAFIEIYEDVEPRLRRLLIEVEEEQLSGMSDLLLESSLSGFETLSESGTEAKFYENDANDVTEEGDEWNESGDEELSESEFVDQVQDVLAVVDGEVDADGDLDVEGGAGPGF